METYETTTVQYSYELDENGNIIKFFQNGVEIDWDEFSPPSIF